MEIPRAKDILLAVLIPLEFVGGFIGVIAGLVKIGSNPDLGIRLIAAGLVGIGCSFNAAGENWRRGN